MRPHSQQKPTDEELTAIKHCIIHSAFHQEREEKGEEEAALFEDKEGTKPLITEKKINLAVSGIRKLLKSP